LKERTGSVPVECRAENDEVIQEVFLRLDVACRCLLPPLNTMYVLLKIVTLGNCALTGGAITCVSITMEWPLTKKQPKVPR
jgi:hypothetical protein